MGRHRKAVAECNCREVDRWLKEHLIHGLNDNDMLIEIIHALTAMKDMSIVTNEQVLAWAMWVEAQGLQIVILGSLRETHDFDAIVKENGT